MTALACLWLSACDPADAGQPAKPAAPEFRVQAPDGKMEAKSAAPTSQAPSPAAVRHMRALFEQTTAVKQAIVEGALADVKAPAQALAEHTMVGGAATWEPHAQALRREATRAANARDLATAARALAMLGTSCGACHVAHSQSPRPSGSPTPADEPAPAKQMLLHQWAADRMWEGLVRPSSESWSDGCGALAEAPLAEERDELTSKAATELIGSIRALADEACEAERPSERAELYAKLITTCSSCHRG